NGARVLYIGGYLAMPSVTPQSLATLFREARNRGLITVLDVVMPAGSSFGIEHVARALEYTDYFLRNEAESQRLTGHADERSQAERLSALNPECAVVITLGRRGSLAMQGNRVIETPSFRMETV